MSKTCLTCQQPMASRKVKYCSNACADDNRNKVRSAVNADKRLRLDKLTEDDLKTCVSCDKEIARRMFHNDGKRPDGKYPYCKDCRRERIGSLPRKLPQWESKAEYDRQYRANRKADPKYDGAWREKQLWTQYRLHPSEYAEMLEAQEGVCGLCGAPDNGPTSSKQGNISGYPFSVDHDHNCCPGKSSCGECVRGLLCRRCNTMLGMAGDDAEILRKAADYLDGFACQAM